MSYNKDIDYNIVQIGFENIESCNIPVNKCRVNIENIVKNYNFNKNSVQHLTEINYSNDIEIMLFKDQEYIMPWTKNDKNTIINRVKQFADITDITFFNDKNYNYYDENSVTICPIWGGEDEYSNVNQHCYISKNDRECNYKMVIKITDKDLNEYDKYMTKNGYIKVY